MRHFMHHNVFQALLRLLGKFCVEANRPSAVIATSPLGLHLLDVEPLTQHFAVRAPDGKHFGDVRGLGSLTTSSARQEMGWVGQT
jgi:hypothetical protein